MNDKDLSSGESRNGNETLPISNGMKYVPQISMYLGGVLFGLGLAYSGAARPEIVLSFLHLDDLGLLLVMGAALLVTTLVFNIVPKFMRQPVFGGTFDGHNGIPITKRSIVGAVIFGIGWGISGLCPATSFAAIGMGNAPILIGIVGMFIGGLIYGTIRSKGEVEN